MGVRPGLGICRGLKGFDADAVEGVDEAFVGMAVCQIGADQALDRVGKLGGGKRPADHFADAGIVALASAQRDLVPLLPFLSTPRMPIAPRWWWPQEFMQPEMLSSSSPMSCW
jgi:hypothetical protein